MKGDDVSAGLYTRYAERGGVEGVGLFRRDNDEMVSWLRGRVMLTWDQILGRVGHFAPLAREVASGLACMAVANVEKPTWK